MRPLGATIKIYSAGPLGFSEAGRAFHETHIVAELQRLGHDVLDPWKLTDAAKIAAVMSLPYGQERREQWSRLNMEIGRTNAEAIDACDVDQCRLADAVIVFEGGQKRELLLRQFARAGLVRVKVAEVLCAAPYEVRG